MKMTQAEFLRAPGEAYRLMKERGESIAIIGDKGETRMILHHHKKPPPCACDPGDRMWICIACDGDVPTSCSAPDDKRGSDG